MAGPVFSLFMAFCLVLGGTYSQGYAAPFKVRVGVEKDLHRTLLIESGEPSGICNDILEYAAEKEGWELVYVPCSWSDCLGKLEKGEIDLVSGIGYSKDRRDKFHFTVENVFSDWGLIITRTGLKITSILELEGKRVALLSKGVHGDYLLDLIRRFGIDCTVLNVDASATVFELVEAGAADCGVVSRGIAGMETGRFEFRKSPVVFNPVEVKYAAPAGAQRHLIEALDAHLTALKQDEHSVYYKSLERWIEADRKGRIPLWLECLVALAFFLVVILMIRVCVLRSQVYARTRQLIEKNRALRWESEERLQAEQALLESEAGLRIILADNPVPMVVSCFESRRYLYVNKAYCDLRGVAYDKLVGTCPKDNILGSKRYRELTDKLRNEGRFDGEEIVRYSGEGNSETFFISCRLTTLGGQKCVISSLIDISDRKRAELALRESQMRYSSIFNSVENALIVYNLNGLIADANDSACRMYGYDRNELIGMHGNIIVNQPYQALFEKLLVDPELAGQMFVSFMCVKKDGSFFNSEARCRRFHMDGGVHMLSVIRDVTALKQAEEEMEKLVDQLHRAQKMEAIGTLAEGIAHDFNNILAGIVGYVELGMESVLEGDSKLPLYLSRIHQASGRARDLVRQMLKFSRGGDTGLKPLEVGPVVKEVLKLLRSTQPGTIELREVFPEAEVRVMGDDTQIHQVVMNLCTNAFHAMGEAGGVLTVRLETVSLATPEPFLDGDLSPGRYAKLLIGDTGPGMDSETVRRIFEAYFTTREVGKGNGLGLSVTRGIVKRHGGGIAVHSTPGEGTEFTVLLPLMASGKIELKQRHEPVARGSEQILFVEDEVLFVEIVREHLEKLGYRVSVATDCRKALEIFRADPGRFDLVITDQTMPEMTGVELTAAIRDIRPDIPVLLCTGFSETLNEKRAMELGISGLVMKPVTRGDIARAVRVVLDKRGEYGEYPDYR